MASSPASRQQAQAQQQDQSVGVDEKKLDLSQQTSNTLRTLREHVIDELSLAAVAEEIDRLTAFILTNEPKLVAANGAHMNAVVQTDINEAYTKIRLLQPILNLKKAIAESAKPLDASQAAAAAPVAKQQPAGKTPAIGDAKEQNPPQTLTVEEQLIRLRKTVANDKASLDLIIKLTGKTDVSLQNTIENNLTKIRQLEHELKNQRDMNAAMAASIAVNIAEDARQKAIRLANAEAEKQPTQAAITENIATLLAELSELDPVEKRKESTEIFKLLAAIGTTQDIKQLVELILCRMRLEDTIARLKPIHLRKTALAELKKLIQPFDDKLDTKAELQCIQFYIAEMTKVNTACTALTTLIANSPELQNNVEKSAELRQQINKFKQNAVMRISELLSQNKIQDVTTQLIATNNLVIKRNIGNAIAAIKRAAAEPAAQAAAAAPAPDNKKQPTVADKTAKISLMKNLVNFFRPASEPSRDVGPQVPSYFDADPGL